MNNNGQLLREQIASTRQSFFDEGTLDSYFVQLEQLEGPDDPNFVQEIFTLYFKDSTSSIAKMMNNLDKNPPDFLGTERLLHQMKANSASIGAVKVKEKVVSMRLNVRNRELERAREKLQDLKTEYEQLKSKLESYFQLLGQVTGPADDQGAVSPGAGPSHQ